MTTRTGQASGRERAGRRRRARTRLLATAAAFLVAATTGCSAFGGSLSVVWEAPADNLVEERGNGAWLVGDTLVRSRYDKVTAFAADTGKARWEYTPPGRERVCAVSRNAVDSVVLIARGRSTPEGCTTVAALDLTTGRERWHTARTAGGRLTETLTGMVAAGGGLAVLRDADDDWAIDMRPGIPGAKALRAFDLRTGAKRWTAAVPEGCVPEQVEAGKRQVVAVLACDRTELSLAAFAPDDGRLRWTAPLGSRAVPAPDGQLALVSAEPAMVRTATRELAPGAFLAFDEAGKTTARIDFKGDYGDLRAHVPALVSVRDGRLYVGAEGLSGRAHRGRVVAFDLKDGRRLWLENVAVAGGLRGLDVTGDRVTVLSDQGSREDGHEELRVLDAADGDEREKIDTGLDMIRTDTELAALFTYKDQLVTARRTPGSPFTMYTRD
ncbi:outer membrane protein assembly factor BamB family protein [Streptomyces sp. NBC_00525]|uniref:outer membrane protein assembly factor BamB family protein n=1 Tax=Streptomyces sp. NBC_00525 TaxID=2903660 RepID=UPI002E801837|nr:PQQ-binding-like beta-propeller repeat protein [Streptomyces sp. NBC_00525]WUC94718.1 PQQ-binding-like beta-propeller repeat protein [Streptomyces sp. NBC_00525]